MITFQIQPETESGPASDSKTLSIKNSVDEITLREFVDFQLLLADADAYIAEFLKLEGEESIECASAWDAQQWIGFYSFLASAVGIFGNCDIYDLMELPKDMAINGEQGGDSLVALFKLVTGAISSYEPQMINKFNYKGKTFLVPPKIASNLGRPEYGPGTKTIEFIEALQVEHVFGAKGEDGEFLIKDRRYHTDLGIMAAICRMVKPDGTVERLPLDMNERRNFISQRIKFFENIPIRVALDVGFFLLSSSESLKLTHTLDGSFSLMRAMRRKL